VFESHLDPFGCLTNFLDAAFRNVFNGGVIVVSATDVASLYGTCPAPALRNYGARIVRTDFVKEMAVRVVVSALARLVTSSISYLAKLHDYIIAIELTVYLIHEYGTWTAATCTVIILYVY